MEPAVASYSLPDEIEPDLAQLLAYWTDLIRAESSMPFSDDVNTSEIRELSPKVVLLTAFDNPDRFRFEAAGDHVNGLYGSPLNGIFSDETEARPPLDEFTEQCRATVLGRSPTYYRSSPSANGSGYSRLLLPTWGDGRVMLLLGAITAVPGTIT